MKRLHRWILFVVAAIVSIPVVFIGSSAYLLAMVEEEYRTGARVSTNGDWVSIPAFGLTFAWMVLLLGAGGVAGVIVSARAWVRRREGVRSRPSS